MTALRSYPLICAPGRPFDPAPEFPEVSSSSRALKQQPQIIISLDHPEHDELCRLISRFFTIRRVSAKQEIVLRTSRLRWAAPFQHRQFNELAAAYCVQSPPVTWGVQ